MRFRELFQVFSRRSQPDTPEARPLTDPFRSRVLMRCRDSFGSLELGAFWEQIHSKLTYLRGRPRLSDHAYGSEVDDVLAFLTSCSDEHFLDFVEIVFRVDAFFHANRRDSFVEDINEFLQIDDLPYVVSDFVWTKRTVTESGSEYESTVLTEYPRVIRKDSDFLYRTALEPALLLLSDGRYSTANSEFLEALEDYRRGDYGDCLVKCGSAFESVLKVICHSNRWSYSQEDTAAILLRTVLANSNLEPFFEQPLIVIATLRNRLSKAHGAGIAAREIKRETAEYSLNATAAAVLLLFRASLQ